jgi:hypothetical protein
MLQYKCLSSRGSVIFIVRGEISGQVSDFSGAMQNTQYMRQEISRKAAKTQRGEVAEKKRCKEGSLSPFFFILAPFLLLFASYENPPAACRNKTIGLAYG